MHPLTPQIETERLILRSLETSDLAFIYRHFSDPDVCRFLYDAEPFESEQEALDLISGYNNPNQKSLCRWAIVWKETGEVAGTCGFHLWDHENKTVELGYDLSRLFWGKGIAVEAVNAVLDHAFANWDVNRIQAFIAVENAQSVRAIEKLGFTREGVVRDKHFFRGQFYDHFLYSMLKRERVRSMVV